MNAYDQLLAEGYLEGHVGSGTYVARSQPDDLLRAGANSAKPLQFSDGGRRFARRGAATTTIHLNRSTNPNRARPFCAGIPAVADFPAKLWSRLLLRYWHEPTRDLLGYGDPAGYWPLREAIATYLGLARDVQCSPEQVIITAGRLAAFDLAMRVLLDHGDAAWIEDPGYVGARSALIAAGARLVPVPIDNEGIDVSAGETRCPDARLAYVSPSHQYPLGVAMTMARRLALLGWAKSADAWILEDDSDCEYRYGGRPLPAMQGLDQEGRVIYFGTFSKVMFPALRLAYLVVPSDRIVKYVKARTLHGRFSPMIEQAALSDFIREGHFARHIRRMRELYKSRQQSLIDALYADLDGVIDVQRQESGLHLVGFLPEGVDGAAVSHRAAAYGVHVEPLSVSSLKPEGRDGLVLGYAGYDEQQLRRGVQKLARILRETSLTAKAS